MPDQTFNHPIAGKKRLSEIIILAQPVSLRGQIPVDDIALLILETPRNHDDDIAFANPCPLLDLALDPAHPFNAINTADTNVVCAHHQFGLSKLLAQFFLGESYSDIWRPIGIEFRSGSGISWFFCVIVN